MRTNFLIIFIFLTTSLAFGQKKEFESPSQTNKQSSILFKTLIYDFGKITHESEAKAVFVFKNISKHNIKLTNVQTTCGCTAAEWPREEIAKRKKQKIIIQYDSRIIGKFQKYIYVYVAGLNDPIQLQIKGEVLPSEINQNEKEQSNTDKKQNSFEIKEVKREVDNKSIEQPKNKINNNQKN